MEGRVIGVSWMPNLSGKVFTKSNIRRLVNGRTVHSGFFSFRFDLKGDDIVASVDGESFASIRPVDRMGLCTIVDITGSSLSLEAEDAEGSLVFIAMHRALWMELRRLVDGCSEGCPCTAMDTPIVFDGTGSMFDLVADKFVRSLESTADSGFYASALGDESPSAVAKRVLIDETVNRSNVLYFQRYIDMYGDRMSTAEDYRSQIRCRTDKSALASHYYSETHRIESEERLESMICASNSLTESTNEVLDTIRRFTESSNSLIRSTNEMSEKSDRKADLSLKVAIVSMFLTFAALVVNIVIAIAT